MIRPPRIHALLPPLAATALAACVADGSDAPMRITHNAVPGEGCSVDSALNTHNDDGIIDINAGAGYVFTPVVVNDILLVEGEAVAPKTIYVEGARVEIEFFDTVSFDAASFPEGLLRFQVPSAGSIDPGGGRTGFSFEVVPFELIEMMTPTIVASSSGITTVDVRVQMFGVRGGGEVESQWFRYPVQICAGCLLQDLGACSSLPQGFMGSSGGACNTLQDGVLQCCDDFTVCPARPPIQT